MHGGGGDWLERRKARPQRPAWPTLRRALLLHRAHLGKVTILLAVIITGAFIGLVPSLLLKKIVDDGIVGHDTGLLNQLALAMIFFFALSAGLQVMQSYFSTAIGQGVMYDLRSRLYRHLTSMSLRWFTANRTGEVLSRVSNDVGAVQGVVSDTLGGVVGNAITALSTFLLMLALDWRLALISVAILPLFIFPARRVGNAQRELQRQSQEQLANMSSHMQETLSVSGALLVKTFGRQEMEADRFDATNRTIRSLNLRRAMAGRWFFVAMNAFGTLAPVVVYWYGGHRAIGGEASLGTVVTFAALLQRLFGPVSQLLSVNVTLLSSLALFERLFDFIDLEQEIADKSDAVDLARVEGHVRFEDVTFAYVAGHNALEHVSFDAPAGAFVALVGHSGAGKTTAAYLVPRLYDVNGGRITVDGYDVRDITQSSLAEAVGMVSQEPYLFHTSIRDNLRYAKPGASDGEVEAAARAANIHDFIAALPYGYDTIVGERGYRLSGGEKQRVAIARALLKDPAILILDEATSSVDSITERVIQDALERLTHGRTVVAIAHRLSTVLAADLIVVLEHGRVAEQGTHAELIARGGLYANLYHEQFEGRLPEGVAT